MAAWSQVWSRGEGGRDQRETGDNGGDGRDSVQRERLGYYRERQQSPSESVGERETMLDREADIRSRTSHRFPGPRVPNNPPRPANNRHGHGTQMISVGLISIPQPVSLMKTKSSHKTQTRRYTWQVMRAGVGNTCFFGTESGRFHKDRLEVRAYAVRGPSGLIRLRVSGRQLRQTTRKRDQTQRNVVCACPWRWLGTEHRHAGRRRPRGLVPTLEMK